MRHIHLLLAGLALVGCTSPGGPPLSVVASEINATRVSGDFLLAAGDTVEVRFANKPDWNHQSLVQPDGQASFLVVGEMHAAGLKPAQLRERLTQAYTAVGIGSTDVSVSVVILAPRNIAVIGYVNSPGIYALPGGEGMSLLAALAAAGGRQEARRQGYLGSVLLLRWDAENQKQLSWTIDARPKHWGGGEPILLQEYDVVFVPNTTVDKVNIWVDKYIRQMIPFPQFIVQN